MADQIRVSTEQYKTEFLSTVSHELRTPLTAIKGSVGILAANINSDMSEKSLALSHLALSNTDRLIKIVDDLLDIQKIEAGKLELNIVESNLSVLVKQAIDSMGDYGKQFNVHYQLLDLFEDAIVKVDETRFVQVMHNLLSNATKYGKHNEAVEICIIPYKVHVRVGVTDYGSGIPADFQDQVFAKFAQSHSVNSEHARVRGTGLGLSIVKLLVEKMDGEITFYSSDEGTTFFLDLKLA
jgi:signal transduction histidine kinase